MSVFSAYQISFSHVSLRGSFNIVYVINCKMVNTVGPVAQWQSVGLRFSFLSKHVIQRLSVRPRPGSDFFISQRNSFYYSILQLSARQHLDGPLHQLSGWSSIRIFEDLTLSSLQCHVQHFEASTSYSFAMRSSLENEWGWHSPSDVG